MIRSLKSRIGDVIQARNLFKGSIVLIVSLLGLGLMIDGAVQAGLWALVVALVVSLL